MTIERIENDFLRSNTYLLISNDKLSAWLIDVGDVDKVINTFPDGCVVRGVFLTHSHYDHIYGLNRLYELFPDVIVYTNEIGRDALFSDRLNFSLYHDMSFVYKGQKIIILGEDEEFSLDENVVVTAHYTPGHSLDSYCYCLENYLFTGDAYIPGLKVVTKLRGGNKDQASNSLSYIKKILTNETTLCPGHGDLFEVLAVESFLKRYFEE